MQYLNNGRRATEPVLTQAYSRISADEHVGLGVKFYSTDNPTRLVAVAQLGDHADEYEDTSPAAMCSQEERDGVERAGLIAQQTRLAQRRALSVPAGVINQDAGTVTEIGAKPSLVGYLRHQLRLGGAQAGDSGDVTVVQDIDGVDVAKWHARIQHYEAEGDSSGKIRKCRERLSSGASSVKAGMRKAVQTVSKVMSVSSGFLDKELTASDQIIRHDSAVKTNEKIGDAQPLLPEPSSSPPKYSSLSAPVPKNGSTGRKVSRSDAANAYREITSPQSPGYGYSSRPNDLSVCGPNANLAQVDINVSDFWIRFTERDDRGDFENVNRQACFDEMSGNCTTEAKQWEADKSHHRLARLERQKREDVQVQVQTEARAQRPIRSPGLRRMRRRENKVDNFSASRNIMREASMRGGFGELC